MNQGGWLQGVLGAFMAHIPLRQPAEFLVHEREEFARSVLVAFTPITQ